MMSDTIKSGIIVGVLAILFFTPYLMAKGVSKLDGRTGFGEKVLCAIPFFNLARAEKIYYGHIGIMTFSPIILIAGIATRFYLWYYMYSSDIANTIRVVVFYGVIIFYFISNMIFVYTVLHDSKAVSTGLLVVYTIAFPFGQYYVGNYLSNVIRHQQEKENTFKG